MSSVLTDVKKVIGITEDYTHFDQDIIMHINSAFFVLNQLGVGPEKPFKIIDKSSDWEEFTDTGDIESVKSYVYLKVRQLFDPPSNSAHLNALNENIKEFEWRLNVQVDPGKEDV